MNFRWRVPAAVTVSGLLALFVYRMAESAQHPPSVTPPPRVTVLNTASLAALGEIMRALVPTDEIIPPTNGGEDALLAALRWSGFMHINPALEPPDARGLSDTDLDAIGSLIGGSEPAAGVTSMAGHSCEGAPNSLWAAVFQAQTC